MNADHDAVRTGSAIDFSKFDSGQTTAVAGTAGTETAATDGGLPPANGGDQ